MGMEDPKPLDKVTKLELENVSLKLRMMQINYQQLQAEFQSIAMNALTEAGLTADEWAIDLDSGTFVKK
jgi:hypothetical protein